MGQMADGGGDVVVQGKVKYQRDCPKGGNQLPESAYGIFWNLFTGSQNVISILKQQGPGVDIAAALASGHGMASDEPAGESGSFNLFMNLRLYASHVGKDAGR